MKAIYIRLQIVVSILIVLLISIGCQDRELRGFAEPSEDEKTYLVFENLAGDCDPRVDDEPWPYPIGTKGPIQPGSHTVECFGEIGFSIEEGVVFHFDYWGP